MEAEGLLHTRDEGHREMSQGLSTSLFTMQRVLCDILDYQRLESNRLRWVPSVSVLTPFVG